MARVVKKKYPKVNLAKLYIIANINNTILSLTDNLGNVLCNVSCGTCGFKNTKKNSPFAVQEVFSKLKSYAVERYEVKKITEVIVRGYGYGVDLINHLNQLSIEVESINYTTNKRHGGTKLRRERRV